MAGSHEDLRRSLPSKSLLENTPVNPSDEERLKTLVDKSKLMSNLRSSLLSQLRKQVSNPNPNP